MASWGEIFAFFAEKTGWTIEEISNCTLDQLNALLDAWFKPKKEKASSKEDIARFIQMMRGIK